MIKIHVFSKNNFRKYLEQYAIDDNNVESVNKYFICIEPTGGPDCVPIFKRQHQNVLTVVFDDVERDERKWGPDVQHYFDAVAMTIDQGKQIADFIKLIPDSGELVIHCSKGQSRSGAIGIFAAEHFKQNVSDLLRDYPEIYPNKHVLEVLRQS